MAKIAIIDDEAAIQFILQTLFRGVGHDTLLAADGTSGLELIYEHHPDVIILDDMLPDITGSDMCLNLKRDPNLKRTLIVMYSAGHRIRDKKHISTIGADAALSKPARPAELINTVAHLLATHH